MIKPPTWTEEQLKDGRMASIDVFRKRRMEEPLEEYLEAFDDYQGVIEELLESTVDLKELDNQLIEVVTDARLLRALRYLPGPPISEDDLKTLADAVLSPSRLRADPEMAKAIAQIILDGLDRRRFPWVTEGRDPTEAERNAAVMASAALLATARVGTKRRTDDKVQQEALVMAALEASGMTRVAPRDIPVLSAAPKPGEFCGESRLGTRKADIVVGLWDGRVMPIECKVSNSSTNSVKRLNNDAAVKATSWKSDFGTVQVVPSAMLSGVYKLHNLQDAQNRGLILFWAHDVQQLITWIAATKVP
jgi:XamI restriction endonuclease